MCFRRILTRSIGRNKVKLIKQFNLLKHKIFLNVPWIKSLSLKLKMITNLFNLVMMNKWRWKSIKWIKHVLNLSSLHKKDQLAAPGEQIYTNKWYLMRIKEPAKDKQVSVSNSIKARMQRTYRILISHH